MSFVCVLNNRHIHEVTATTTDVDNAQVVRLDCTCTVCIHEQSVIVVTRAVSTGFD